MIQKIFEFYWKRRKLIVSSRQEIDFEIDFIKLCKIKLNTTSLWFKQIRKIESSSNFWSKIEKTISLKRRRNMQMLNKKKSLFHRKQMRILSKFDKTCLITHLALRWNLAFRKHLVFRISKRHRVSLTDFSPIGD